MVSITVSSARPTALARDLPVTIEFSEKTVENVTIADVKAAVAQKYPRFYTARQKLSLKDDKKALSDETTLASAGVSDGGELVLKDLGAQIGWRTVFLWEYVGPLFIHSAFYYFPRLFYGGPIQHSLLQQYVYAMIIIHFLKREYETIFIHRFSNGTMPLYGLFRNCFHYWVLSGLALGYVVYGPTYAAASPYIRGTIRSNPTFLWSCIAVWILAEVSNYRTHAILRDLRPVGTKERRIPYGFGFNLISCPNYFFELIGWTVISVMTGSYAAHVFLISAAYIQTVWAIKKHKLYKKQFGDKYPKNRKVIFPFVF